jgi:hypothetical protein
LLEEAGRLAEFGRASRALAEARFDVRRINDSIIAAIEADDLQGVSGSTSTP